MAENKKSVLLYCDLIHTVEKLDNETAGELFKHYLRYINDQNPKTENVIVDIVFESIKQNLKRDLKKWSDTITSKSDAGNLGNLKRWYETIYDDVISNKITLEKGIELSQEIAKHRTATKDIANIAVTDTVNVTVNDTDTVKVKDIKSNNTTTKKEKTFSGDVIKSYENCLTFFPEHLHPKKRKPKK